MRKILVGILTTIFVSILIINCGGESKSGAKKAKSMLNKTKKAKVEMVVDFANGEKTYNKVCIACHLTGVAGAAAIKDKPRWEENAKLGMEELHKHVIDGVPAGKYGVMPPRGTCTDCSDKDLYDAVGYMLREAGVTVAKK